LRDRLNRSRAQLRALTALPARGADAIARCAPFFLFIAALALSSAFDLRWLVVARGGLVALALLWFWPAYGELKKPAPVRSSDWLIAALAGVAVFLAWIQFDQEWMVFGHTRGFDPRLQDGSVAWSYALARLAGFVLVVPVMEELFWRSFLLRWLEQSDFLDADPRNTRWLTFFATAAAFGTEHSQWFAGLLAGMVYNGLYMRSRNLWVPILAHAVTNGVLGLWILFTHNWQFW
jgi:CAAX prenyl protease-like protein